MSTKCPLCGDSKSKDSLFCAACTERLNSQYEVDVPTAEPSEEHTDNIAPNSKEMEEKGVNSHLKRKSVIKNPLKTNCRVGEKHQTNQKLQKGLKHQKLLKQQTNQKQKTTPIQTHPP